MSLKNFSELKENDVIRASFWKEPIRVIKIRPKGAERAKIEGKGIKNPNHLYCSVLLLSDLPKISKVALKRDLEGDSKNLQVRLMGELIRMTYGFDPFFGLSVSKVNPVPHQLEAVYDYILKKPRINFLLADDAGAGKTIMSGLVLKELKYRGLADRVLIVAPKFLNRLWQRELSEKFQENYKIIDRGVLNSFTMKNVWQEINRGVVSIDFAKKPGIRQSLSSVKWDLVIVDEAHKLAAYKRGKNKIERTQRFKLGRILEQNADNLLLLTATPHKGDINNFFLLLSLLERDIFNPKIVLRGILSPSEMSEKITKVLHNKKNPIFLRRMKENMKNWDGSDLFPPRESITLKYTLMGKEKELYDAVTEYIERYYRKAAQKKRTNVIFALIIIQRRFASSIHTGRKSLERRLEGIKEALKLDSVEEEIRLLQDVKSWKGVEEKLEDLPEKKRWEIEEKLSRLGLEKNIEELELEKEKLEKLVELAKKVEDSIEERKLKELWEVLERKDLLKTGNKLLVFTEAKDTLSYLKGKFQQKGYKVVTIHGDKKEKEREEAERSFNKGDAQIMIATKAAREGINLQESCWLMVNYDIPWNPNWLEQRIGRIHRYGQDRKVHVYNLVAENTREGRVLTVVLDKLDKIQEVLGSKVFDVIGKIFEGKNLETVIEKAIMENKPTDFYDRLEGIKEDVAKKIEEYTQKSLAKKHINLPHIADQLKKNEEERLPPEYIEKFFVKTFAKLGGRIEKKANKQWYIKYVPAKIRRVSESKSFERRYGKIMERYGLVSFYSEISQKEDIDFITPCHPLLEALIEFIDQKFNSELEKGAVFYDPDGKYNGIIWFFESVFKDGLDDVVDKSIVPVYKPLNGEPRIVDLSLIWDLVPGKQKIPEKYHLALGKKKKSVGLVCDKLDKNREKITRRRENESEIRKHDAKRSLEALILDSDGKIMEYQDKQREGKDMEIKIRQERDKKKKLKRRRDKIEEESDLKKSITYDDPRIFTSIAVLPHPSPEAKEMYRDEEVERIAMKRAIKYEREEGRNPEDVSDENLGCDIRSAGEEEIRYIEVKGRAETGQLYLTTNEWMKAKRFGKKFWLYIVTNTKESPELYIIQDPASQLKPKKKIRYLVSKQNWQKNAKKAD